MARKTRTQWLSARYLSRNRQRKTDKSTAGTGTLSPDSASMLPHDFPADRQTQSAAATSALIREKTDLLETYDRFRDRERRLSVVLAQLGSIHGILVDTKEKLKLEGDQQDTGKLIIEMIHSIETCT